MSEEVGGVGLSGIMADMPRPMLKMSTRHNYLVAGLQDYKQMIRYRFYAVSAGLIGIYLMFTIPILSLALLFLAPYYWQLHKLQKMRTTNSTRTVMIGH